MKTYRQLVSESTQYINARSVEDAKALISGFLSAGEILNPQYKQLSDSLRRLMDKDFKAVRELFRSHTSAGDSSDALLALYYGWPFDSLAAVGPAEKKLATFEKQAKDPVYQPLIKMAKATLAVWGPIAKDMKTLKGKVVNTTQKRAEAKQAAAAVATSKRFQSPTLIKLLESYLPEYLKEAEAESRNHIKYKLKKLEDHGWDLNSLLRAVGKDTYRGHAEYKRQQQERALYTRITKPAKDDVYTRSAQDIRKPNPEGIESVVSMDVEVAEQDYHDFVAKMIDKIGKPVVQASMTGSIWTNALLTVTCNDGEVQKWYTQVIINFSKYNKMFNQFPSRRVK